MTSFYREDIDWLRAIAVLSVVAFHFEAPVYGGFVGVDIFFVISGYLITGIIQSELKSGTFSFAQFYERRVRRLLPALYVMVALTALPTFHYLLASERAEFFRSVSSVVTFTSNIFFWFQTGYFDYVAVEKPLLHTWSLAVEEQFYLIWPWIIVSLGSRRRILRFSIYGSIATLALRLILIQVIPASGSFLYIELPTRADSLLIGAAVAMIFRDPELIAKIRLSYVRIAGLAAAAGFLALGLEIHSFFWQTPPISTWGFSLTAIASAALVFLAMTPGTWTSRIFSNSILRFYGRYSYGLYLIHFAPKYYYDEVFLPAISSRVHPAWLAGTIGFAIVLAASTAAAVLSFHIIEMPFLKMKKRFESGSRKESKPREKELVTPESVESET
jgi:peptidoglycan/LPS O-acetylase OafA/YrhL